MKSRRIFQVGENQAIIFTRCCAFVIFYLSLFNRCFINNRISSDLSFTSLWFPKVVSKVSFLLSYVAEKLLNIDVPIALGILVLFVKSTVDIIFDLGSGFFDSLKGLVFFLLLGKFCQQKTYAFLSFERDYKSYFPIAITKLTAEGEFPVQVYEIQKGDRLLIRNDELIPLDGFLINGNASIDYSFVTGESETVRKRSGDKLFAGGKYRRCSCSAACAAKAFGTGSRIMMKFYFHVIALLPTMTVRNNGYGD